MADEGVSERLGGLVAMSSGDTRLDTLIRVTCGRALSLPPLPWETDLVDGTSDREAVVVAFAEQFTVDVTGIGENQRARLLSTLGDNAFRTVVAVFIADFVPRVWAGFGALGLGKPGNGGPVESDHDTDPIGALLNGFVPAVARLRALDPVTTEPIGLQIDAARATVILRVNQSVYRKRKQSWQTNEPRGGAAAWCCSAQLQAVQVIAGGQCAGCRRVGVVV